MRDQKDTFDVLSSKGRHGYKQQVREQNVEIEPEKNYTPSQVAAALEQFPKRCRLVMARLCGDDHDGDSLWG